MIQREIKFDIILWDGKDPKTIEHYTFEEALKEDFIDFKDGGIVPPDNSVIIRQYTGLHDKNGKGIYEGDILQSSYGDGTYCYPIIWSENESGWRLGGKGNAHKIEKTFGKINMVIIGNTVENPELLKE